MIRKQQFCGCGDRPLSLEYLLRVLEKNRDLGLELLKDEVRSVGFQESFVDWARVRTLSFLDEGWCRGLENNVTLLPDSELSKDQLGQFVNKIVRGSRPEVSDERYVGKGKAPTLLTLASYVFYRISEPPPEAKREKQAWSSKW